MAEGLQRSSPAPAPKRIREFMQQAKYGYARGCELSGDKRSQHWHSARPIGEYAVVEDDRAWLRLLDFAADPQEPATCLPQARRHACRSVRVTPQSGDVGTSSLERTLQDSSIIANAADGSRRDADLEDRSQRWTDAVGPPFRRR